MLSKNAAIQTVDTALLSATTADREAKGGGAALLQVAGHPLLLHQMQQLIAVGIRKFLIEVDAVSGAVVAVADMMKKRGIQVEFIRSPMDLQDRLGAGELLFVMAEGVVANDDLIAEMAARPSAYIVTLDGRRENEIFERIDLNSFWSGVALFDRRTVNGIAALPAGWSIASSLLRQALQDAVIHRSLGQELITSKLFRRVTMQDDADALTRELLMRRAHDADGFIEAHLFGPVAAKLTPLFWNAPGARRMLNGGLLFVAAASAGLAAAGFALASVAAMLAALFLMKLQGLLHDGERPGIPARAGIGAVWGTMGGALLLISWDFGRGGIGALFAPMVMLALLFYAAKSALSSMQKASIASPALAALLLLIAAMFGAWSLGICAIVMAQLLVLLWPHIFLRRDGK